ncbi:MAG: DUF3077 domain-containing protein [Pseudomonas sp.]|uniref:DUF3077 domain-containing protein n=1 Tax=Pseudomonas abieticivorans TaxID=2931382 RepID=UPI0020BED89C|nr:DUF3077 domain-containing protein [Pseudomonas sp. PIA16]MDE1169353.1 DUF3077 domain-containing protein [Pseudomonas sp.]
MNDITETTALPFGLCDSGQQPYFSVNSGISLEDALTHLSHLLKCAHASTFELCDTPNPDRGLVWSALHHIEGAKGLVDALLAGHESRNGG